MYISLKRLFWTLIGPTRVICIELQALMRLLRYNKEGQIIID